MARCNNNNNIAVCCYCCFPSLLLRPDETTRLVGVWLAPLGHPTVVSKELTASNVVYTCGKH